MIPRRATVSRDAGQNVNVVYQGEPEFETVAGTEISRVTNSPNDVLLVDGQFYLCLNAVWYVADNANGPWEVADFIPAAVYSIPPSSPAYHVTNVHVYESDDETVSTGYTGGYVGVYVSHGVPMYGTGYHYMGTNIHPSAIIEDGAQLGTAVSVGPFAYIGAQVRIGDHSVIHHHATVDGNTVMGESNEIYPYAFVGGKTHDLKYTGGTTGLKIGDRNVFREYVSVHMATDDADFTILGSDNVVLAYCHVAHDCQIKNHLIMSSHSALGGHVIVDDHVNIGWGVGVHQFCRIGTHAMCGACSKVVQDVLPFMIADGNPAAVRTINKIGMERQNFSSDDVAAVRQTYKCFYREGLNRSQAADQLRESNLLDSSVIKQILAFVDASDRGLA